ncbi:type II toxin-antitoxin system RelE/ParE family toxin [Asticcacaulis sp.]|uniref:type II toxin-antitoxin system RelE/ParE family toxin n=1 Tax=Asticcacaulis sp. TaxID=1872648 RepID=UPI003F7C3742
MEKPVVDGARVFKTAWFSRAARKALIKDTELCAGIADVMAGLGDNLGGGVFKKRLNKNRHRSIILARGGNYWVYAFLFAKKDRANIDDEELDAFRKLAGIYAGKSTAEIDLEVAGGELMEICNDCASEI